MSRAALLLHGAFAGAWSVAPLAAHLFAQGWICHAPDLPGHGARRRELRGTLSLRDYVADMAAFARGLPEPPVVIGHSLGGLIAQQLAAAGLARAALLLAPAAPWGVLPATAAEGRNALGLLRAGAFWHKALPPDPAIALRTSLDKLSPAQQRNALAQFGPESGRVLFELFYWWLDARQAAFVDARKVACPMLCLVGAEDKVVSPGTVRSIAHRYRRVAHYRVLPGMSHYLFGEPNQPLLFAACDEWLAGLD